MRRCEFCGQPLEDDDRYCPICQVNLWLQKNHFMHPWSEGVVEANNIHWLAQCQRRLLFPIEPTEEVSFAAFEYGWKVLNRLYNELTIPKVLLDAVSGKKREANAKESILFLFKTFGVAQAIIEQNRSSIQDLCDCVLEVSDKAYMGDKRGFITFDDVSEKKAFELSECAIAKCKTLADAIHQTNYDEAAAALVETLLSVRNARVHAAHYKEGKKVPPGGVGHSKRLSRDGSDKRRDYEIYVVATILLSMGMIVIASKTQKDVGEIEGLVNSRTGQLARAIYDTVISWKR
jgi:hypothetical protein